MKLKSIEFENFRIFENQKFEFKPLTVLTGPNSSGKSTLVKGLTLLQENLKAPNHLGTLAFKSGNHKLGDFKSIRTRDSKDNQISFKLIYEFPYKEKSQNTFDILSNNDIRISLKYDNNKEQVENGLLVDYKIEIDEYIIQENSLTKERKRILNNSDTILHIYYHNQKLYFFLNFEWLKDIIDSYLRSNNFKFNTKPVIKIISDYKWNQQIKKILHTYEKELNNNIKSVKDRNFNFENQIDIEELNQKKLIAFKSFNSKVNRVKHEYDFLKKKLEKISNIRYDQPISAIKRKLLELNKINDKSEEISKRETLLNNELEDLLKFKEEDVEVKDVEKQLEEKESEVNNREFLRDEQLELFDIEIENSNNDEYDEEHEEGHNILNEIDKVKKYYKLKKSNVSKEYLLSELEKFISHSIHKILQSLVSEKIESNLLKKSTTLGTFLMKDVDGNKNWHSLVNQLFYDLEQKDFTDFINWNDELDFIRNILKEEDILISLKNILSTEDDINQVSNSIISIVQMLINQSMKKIPFISLSSNRGIQKRLYRIAKPQYHIENALSTLLSIRYSKVDNDKDELNNEKFQFIQDWLLKFGIIEKGQILTAKSLDGDFVKGFIADKAGNEIVNIADLGLGITQLLPIIIYTADAIGKNQLICIEEPGTHLHPDFQAKLVDFMLDANKEHQTQFLIETHSGVFLKALHYMVKDEILTDKELVIYFKNKESKKFKKINIDKTIGLEQQYIDYWDDFLDKYTLRSIRDVELKNNELEEVKKTFGKSLEELSDEGNRIIFCENKNAEFFNNFKFPNVLFIPAKDKGDIVFKCLNYPNHEGLIDKDYMTNKEIEIVKNSDKHKNLHFLKYYSFENYIYHPENLKEALLYYDDYENDLVEEFNTNVKYKIYANLDNNRKGYDLLKPNFELFTGKNRGKETEEIMKLMESNDFEKVYEFIDIKKYCTATKTKLNFSHNEIKEKLVKTNWFKQQIADILGINLENPN